MDNQRLTLDARYLAAWNEISTRIGQRQALISIYTSLAFTALGVPLLPNGGGLWRFVYAVPPLSLVFALLLRMHERMIRLLNEFLAALEADAAGPCYYAGLEWAARVSRARAAHDWVCFGLVVGVNCAALVVALAGPRSDELTGLDHLALTGLAGVVLMALRLITYPPAEPPLPGKVTSTPGSSSRAP